MHWIAKINHKDKDGKAKVHYITAPTITGLYAKLYKSLHLKWIDCLIYQDKKP